MSSVILRVPNRVTWNAADTTQMAALATTLMAPKLQQAANLAGLPPGDNWQPKPCTILTNRDSFVIPYTDPKVVHSNIQRTKWVTIDRPGARPYVGNGGGTLREMKLTGVLGSVKRDATWIEGQMINLSYMLSVPEPLTIAYGRFESEGIQWRCTSADISTVYRFPGTNKSWWVDLDLKFIEASDAPYPQPAPAVPAVVAAPPPQALAVKIATQSAKRTYTIKKGDTLWALAVKYYNDGTKWPKIADASGVRDPKRLQIGQVVTIP